MTPAAPASEARPAGVLVRKPEVNTLGLPRSSGGGHLACSRNREAQWFTEDPNLKLAKNTNKQKKPHPTSLPVRPSELMAFKLGKKQESSSIVHGTLKILKDLISIPLGFSKWVFLSGMPEMKVPHLFAIVYFLSYVYVSAPCECRGLRR